MTDGQEIRARLEHQIDAVLDGGNCGFEPTTVVDLAVQPPAILRQRKGRCFAANGCATGFPRRPGG